MRKHFNLALILVLSFVGCGAPQPESLVPETSSSAPDYFCTWNIQGYIAYYPNTSDAMREQMVEENLFGNGPYQNWLEFFPAIRSDLYFVMDDSWDIPRSRNERWNNPYYGTMELSNPSRGVGEQREGQRMEGAWRMGVRPGSGGFNRRFS